MMKSTFKNLCKIVIFCMVFLLLGGRLFTIFNEKEMGSFPRFYTSDGKKADVLVFGNSHAHCNIDQRVLWEQYGIAGYTLSHGAQMLDSTYYYIKEAVRKDHPQVIVLEVNGVFLEGANTEETIHYNSLPMAWSPVFFEYIRYFADTADMGRTWKHQVMLKVPLIHQRYSKLEKADFVDGIPFLKGYRGSYECAPMQREDAATEEVAELFPRSEQMLCNIIEFAEKENVPLLLIKTPFVHDEEVQKKLNRVAEIAQEHGISFIDYNRLYDEIGLDFETDFRDDAHLNNYGAAKVTGHLGQFLTEHYAVDDRRGCEGYGSWDQNALYLNNKDIREQLFRAAELTDYLQVLKDTWEGQTIFLMLSGNYDAQGPFYLAALNQMGISEEDYLQGGCFVFRNGKLTDRFPGKEYAKCISVPGGEVHVEAHPDREGEEAGRIIFDGEDQKQVENGVNIFVYNEEIHQIIDAAGTDIYAGREMVHKAPADE